MVKAGSPGGPTGPRAADREARAERLAAALKANLRRRKVQARQRTAEADRPGHDTEPSGAHDSARVIDDKQPT
jgi:hypothetical protein